MYVSTCQQKEKKEFVVVLYTTDKEEARAIGNYESEEFKITRNVRIIAEREQESEEESEARKVI